jgi:hypothetical protein
MLLMASQLDHHSGVLASFAIIDDSNEFVRRGVPELERNVLSIRVESVVDPFSEDLPPRQICLRESRQ